MTPDVNVLLAASRADHPHHECALEWLQSALEACGTGESLEVLPMVAAGFLRLATNPKVFRQPTPTDQAVAFIRSVLQVPGAVMPEIGSEWGSFQARCVDLRLTGNAIPDAWIAAVVDLRGYHLVTFDRDFRNLLRPAQVTLLRS
jgi:uncharacterized protein